MSEKRKIENLDEMKAFAAEIAEACGRGPRCLLLLDGEMGAGKTQFTRFMLEALGSDETASPSFAIHNSYAVRGGGSVEHFDLFRLESEEDLESTGFWDFFRAKAGLVVIEWAERLDKFGLTSQLPRTWPTRKIHFEFVLGQPSAREITLS